MSLMLKFCKFSKLESISTSDTINLFFDKLEHVCEANYNLTKRFIFWTKQERYPILQVTRKFGNRIGINLIEPYTQKLWMYVTFITQENPNITKTTWLAPHESILYLDDINENHWIIVNVQQIGEYKSINNFISIINDFISINKSLHVILHI